MIEWCVLSYISLWNPHSTFLSLFQNNKRTYSGFGELHYSSSFLLSQPLAYTLDPFPWKGLNLFAQLWLWVHFHRSLMSIHRYGVGCATSERLGLRSSCGLLFVHFHFCLCLEKNRLTSLLFLEKNETRCRELSRLRSAKMSQSSVEPRLVRINEC